MDQGGNDTIGGHDGNDTILGGKGNDSITGNNQADVIHGDNAQLDYNPSGVIKTFASIAVTDFGDDEITGFIGDDTILGGSGTDTIGGGTGTMWCWATTARSITRLHRRTGMAWTARWT